MSFTFRADSTPPREVTVGPIAEHSEKKPPRLTQKQWAIVTGIAIFALGTLASGGALFYLNFNVIIAGAVLGAGGFEMIAAFVTGVAMKIFEPHKQTKEEAREQLFQKLSLWVERGKDETQKFERRGIRADVTECFTKLQSGQEASLQIVSAYPLDELPKCIGQLKSLKTLSMTSTHEKKIAKIPDFVFELGQLESLSITGQQITSIPTEIEKLGQLRVVNFYDNAINAIPDHIDRVLKLRKLHLRNCPIESVSKNLEKMTCLKEVIVDEPWLEKSWHLDEKTRGKFTSTGF